MALIAPVCSRDHPHRKEVRIMARLLLRESDTILSRSFGRECWNSRCSLISKSNLRARFARTPLSLRQSIRIDSSRFGILILFNYSSSYMVVIRKSNVLLVANQYSLPIPNVQQLSRYGTGYNRCTTWKDVLTKMFFVARLLP